MGDLFTAAQHFLACESEMACEDVKRVQKREHLASRPKPSERGDGVGFSVFFFLRGAYVLCYAVNVI